MNTARSCCSFALSESAIFVMPGLSQFLAKEYDDDSESLQCLAKLTC